MQRVLGSRGNGTVEQAKVGSQVLAVFTEHTFVPEQPAAAIPRQATQDPMPVLSHLDLAASMASHVVLLR